MQGASGLVRPDIPGKAGTLHDRTRFVDDISAITLRHALELFEGPDAKPFPIRDGAPRVRAPFSGVEKVVSIGLTSGEHAKRSGPSRADASIASFDAASSRADCQDDVVIPHESKPTDREIGPGVTIGFTATAVLVRETAAPEDVAGYCMIDGVSERDSDHTRMGHWIEGRWGKGKPAGPFGPRGPLRVAPDEIGVSPALGRCPDGSGTRSQPDNSETMTFGAARPVLPIGRFERVQRGDIGGVGCPAFGTERQQEVHWAAMFRPSIPYAIVDMTDDRRVILCRRQIEEWGQMAKVGPTAVAKRRAYAPFSEPGATVVVGAPSAEEESRTDPSKSIASHGHGRDAMPQAPRAGLLATSGPIAPSLPHAIHVQGAEAGLRPSNSRRHAVRRSEMDRRYEAKLAQRRAVVPEGMAWVDRTAPNASPLSRRASAWGGRAQAGRATPTHAAARRVFRIGRSAAAGTVLKEQLNRRPINCRSGVRTRRLA